MGLPEAGLRPSPVYASPMLSRIVSGVGAMAFAQGVSVLTQLVSIPVFLHYWSTEVYGQWLMISAIPAYFAMADIGFVAAAANKMTMLTSQGRHAEGNAVFQSAIAMTLLLITAFLLAAMAFVHWVDATVLQPADRKLALLLLTLVALENVFCGLLEAVFRANGRFAAGTYALTGTRLLEWIMGLAGLYLSQGFLGVAAGIFIGRTLAMLSILAYARGSFKNYEWGMAHASTAEIKLMAKPAAAFLALPVGNAISNQGMVLVVGNIWGTAFLAIFNTYRTLSRVLVQVVTSLSRSLWPEITRLYSLGRLEDIRKISRIGTQVVGLANLALAAGIYLLAPWILGIWTKGKIPFNPALLAIFLAATVTTAFWQISMIVTTATNKHEQLSYFYLMASALTVMAAMATQHLAGIYSSALALLVFEIIMLFVGRHYANRALR